MTSLAHFQQDRAERSNSHRVPRSHAPADPTRPDHLAQVDALPRLAMISRHPDFFFIGAFSGPFIQSERIVIREPALKLSPKRHFCLRIEFPCAPPIKADECDLGRANPGVILLAFIGVKREPLASGRCHQMRIGITLDRSLNGRQNIDLASILHSSNELPRLLARQEVEQSLCCQLLMAGDDHGRGRCCRHPFLLLTQVLSPGRNLQVQHPTR
ncbi:hypothetical protein BCO71033_01736 [Burkholderia contaminans]|uniref:Uncharacterized protein n=1 Tax=Burkholderia contaminans TaxID=488447 RepID=A0A6P2WU18_9BURK|nr:hypothetical protein BCO71033_01736 [Burkholderia contaminans]